MTTPNGVPSQPIAAIRKGTGAGDAAAYRRTRVPMAHQAARIRRHTAKGSFHLMRSRRARRERKRGCHRC